MNEKRERFAKVYAATLNATEAAKKAGYSRSVRPKWGVVLTDDQVLERIAEHELPRLAATDLTAARVLADSFSSPVFTPPLE
jgi:phage terminase small subunit